MSPTPTTPPPYEYEVTSEADLVTRLRQSPNALTAYLSAYGVFAAGITRGELTHLERALDYTNFLDESFGLGDFPDVALLDMAVRQSLPPSHPKYREFSRDGLYAVYTHRRLLGALRTTALRNAAALDLYQVDATAASVLWGGGQPELTEKSLNEVAVYIPFGLLDTGIDVHDAHSAVAGWALANITSGDYDRAFAVLDSSRQSGFTSVGEHIAWLILWYTTRRWEDARMASEVATGLSMKQMGIAQGSTDSFMFDQLVRLSQLVGGFAHLGLDDPAQARSLFAAVTVPKTPDRIAAWASYGLGMAYRVGENASPTKSASLISTAVGQHSHPRFTAALTDTTVRYPTTTANSIAQRSDFWDPDTEPDPELEKRQKQQDMRETYRIRADKLLDAQIGMKNVKEQVRRMISTITIERERARRGGGAGKAVNYNLVLTGPPGTGKSTIVDVLALYFASLGIVDNPEPIVTHRADYVADTLGGSAIKTKNTIDNAVGSVLFFDEFYAIVQVADGPNADQFGKEALDTIVAEAETRVGQLVFIIAGYEADIDRVVRVNDGLNSRFPRRIDFGTYSLKEIADIAVLQAQRANLTLDDAAYDFLTDDNGDARNLMATNDSGEMLLNVLGNGRFARNLVETASEYQAHRLMGTGVNPATLSDADLSTLTAEDIKASFAQHMDNALKHG